MFVILRYDTVFNRINFGISCESNVQMESLSPPPNKKVRLMNIEIPFIECRREFKLPQQFPSMVPSLKINGVVTGKKLSVASASGISKNLKDSMSKETSVTNDLKKLRIKAQDGRDLGEVKVKILSRNNILNTKNIISKSNINDTTTKPVKLNIAPLNGTEKAHHLSKRTDGLKVHEKVVIPTNKLFALSDNMKINLGDSNNKLIGKSVILSKSLSRLITNEHNKKVLISTQNGQILHNFRSTNGILPKQVKISTCPPLTDTRKCVNLTVKTNSVSHNEDTFKPKDDVTEVQKKIDNLNIEKFPKDHLELAKSKFPVVKCEKLVLTKNKVNIQELGKILTKENDNKPIPQSGISVLKGRLEEQDHRYIKIPYNAKFSESTECSTNTQTKPVISEIQNQFVQNNDLSRVKLGNGNQMVSILCSNNIATSNIRNKTVSVQTDCNNVCEKDYNLMPVTNKKVHNGVKNAQNINNKTDSCLNSKASDNEHVKNQHSNSQIITNGTDNVRKTINNTSEEEKLPLPYNIIKEALISVTDEKLRAKALQALADCGIGLAKQVPIVPPENLKTIHDTSVQTDVFGLLELESFVLVRTDKPALKRINQTERSTITNDTNLNVSVQAKTKWNYIDNELLFPGMSPMNIIDSNQSIESSFFDDYFSQNPDANRVKQTLSTPHSYYRKVSMQLQKDFAAICHSDENGMLNIHRAVISDNLKELQRLLLILNATKTSIDVETDDGMTSLELAVKFNSSKDILNILLQAGAKPTSTQLIHESAVILASKLSSPSLPSLVAYITDSKHLDQVDSEGLAPLHYCALHGYLEGVSALIEAGADVNLRDKRSGRTPFFHALEQNQVVTAQKLLEYGAVANTPNFSGQSVLSIVDETKSVSLKAALKQVII